MTNLDTLMTLFQKSRPFFHALGDPVRQEIMGILARGEQLSVKEITAQTKLSRPTISHHLRVLKDANIVVETKAGREIFYRPQPGEYFFVVKKLMDTIDELVKQKEQTR